MSEHCAREIPIKSDSISFTGCVTEARPEPGALQIRPKSLIEFPGYPTEEDLVGFDVKLEIPQVTVTTSDEISKAAFRRWRQDLADLVELTHLDKASIAVVEFASDEGGILFRLSGRTGYLLAEGSSCFPYPNWRDITPNVIIEQEKPFPWTVGFAFMVDVNVIESAVSQIDVMLASLPTRAE